MTAPTTGTHTVQCLVCGRPGPTAATLFSAALAATSKAHGWRRRSVAHGAVRTSLYQCPSCPPYECACGARYDRAAWEALPGAGVGTVPIAGGHRHLVWRACTALLRDGSLCRSTVTVEVRRDR